VSSRFNNRTTSRNHLAAAAFSHTYCHSNPNYTQHSENLWLICQTNIMLM